MSKYAENYSQIDWSKDLSVPSKAGRRARFVKGVISDTMDALIHPCTGKLMDSKSEFRKVTKAKGGVEVGNEKLVDRRTCPHLDSESRRRDIAAAMEQLGL